MNYILKHRRGTTSEWLKSSVIPEDGELIIEELANGDRRCKIGDGVNKFNKLSYVDADVRKDLVAKMDLIESQFNKKLINLSSDQIEQLELLKKEITQVITEETFKTEDKLVNSHKQILEQTDQTITDKIADLTSDVIRLNKDVTNSFTSKLELSDKKLTTKINQDILTLTESLTKRLESLTNNFELKLQKLTEESQAQLESLSKQLSEQDNNLSQAYSEKLIQTEKSLYDLIIEHYKKYSQELLCMHNLISEELDKKYSDQNDLIAKLASDTQLADANLLSKLESLKKQSMNMTANLADCIKKIQTQIDGLLKQDIKNQQDIIYVESSLTDLLTTLQGELSVLKQQQLESSADISNSLTELNKTQQESISELSNLIHKYVTQIYVELADLVDDDIAVLKKFTILEADLKNKLADFKSETNIKIKENRKSLEELTNRVQSHELDNQKAFTDTYSTIKTVKSNLTKDFEDLQNQVNLTKNRLSATNLALGTQTNRINNLIQLKPGSTTGDAELIDIRNGYDGITHETAGDAVRAIGNDLETLRTSLPDYIPANAVDGLLYEDSLLYLTSGGVPVADPVEIKGGGGGGGSLSTVKLKNNLSSATFTLAKGNDAWIDFTYTSFENEIPTGDGTYSVSINNKKIESLSGAIQHNVAKRLKVTEYLKNGVNSVKVTCADQYGTSRSLVYSISVIELKVESSFNSAQFFSDRIIFRYKIYGLVEKTIHILIDGKEILNKTLNASVNGSESTLTIPKQSHGSHKIVAYLSAFIDGSEVHSNTLEYEIICVEEDNNKAILTSTYNVTEVTQGDLISIPYMLYDPNQSETSISLTVYSKAAGELYKVSSTVRTAGRGQQLWNTRDYPDGLVVFELKYSYMLYGVPTSIIKTHEVTVNKLTVNISPEEDALQLYLTASGRANNMTNRDIWTFTQQPTLDQEYEPITTTFENFNWKSNGWITDDNGDTCLRLNGDARAIINFKPFADDFKAQGKTLEFEFLVRDVNSRSAEIINCFDGERGFLATPDTAFLQSSGTKISCRYKDNERIRVSITVEEINSISCFVSIYLDGILSGVQKYEQNAIFAQATPSKIILGSSLCGLDIYSIRIYNKALSTPQILANYIADKADPTTKKQLITENNILKDGKISYELAQNVGQVPIITFTGPMPAYKGDKKNKTTRMKFEDPLDKSRNFDVLLDQIDVQGTSSQFYARKNWKVKLPEARSHIPGAIPSKVFCIKVDYAEATGTHNTGSANYIETLYDRNEVTLPPQKDDTRVRTTIQGFPCIIFEKETEDSEPVFASKGNFNYDKGSEDTFGFTEAYKDFGVECWEFCNNTSDPVNFTGPISSNWLDDFEPRYLPKDKQEDFEYIEDLLKEASLTGEQQKELSMRFDTCIENFKKVHDWVLSTAPYTLKNGKQEPIDPVEAEARLTKFKHEFKDYFNMHYCCIYYVFTLFALMTDQRAKNMFLTRWKDEDNRYRWYPYFYDNDTIFGINNEGALVFDYFHEDIDQLDNSNIFNGQNSVLWHNFRLCFQQEIKDTYAKLRSDKKLTYENIINQYVTLGSDKWSATIYNEDAEYKYITMARPSGPNNEVDASNLYQVRGPGEHHLRYFIANRLNYCDSKWYAGDYPSDFYFLRIYTPTTQVPIDKELTDEELKTYDEDQVRIYKSLKVVPASSKITVKPYSDIYAGIRYKSGTLQQKRLKADDEYEFSPVNPNETFNDTETAIYGASELSSLGDLSNLYCGVVNLVGKNNDNGAAEQGNVKENKLKELIIGNSHPDYYNSNFREITVGTCRLLRKIDLSNCAGLGIAGDNPQKTLDLTGCPNIEEIFVEGTNLTTVSLPESGYVKKLHLPESTNTLVIKNQKYIEDFSIPSYANIRTLHIEECPTLNTNEILEACRNSDNAYTVEFVTLSGINWHLQTADFVKSLFAEYDADGTFKSGIRSIDTNGKYTEAILKGECYIEKLTGEDYSEIKSRYPELNISFGEMISKVTFKDAKGETLYTETIIAENSETPNCSDPEQTGKISTPVKETTAEFEYTFIGWTRKLDGEFQQDALWNIAGDRILYPAFKATKRSYEVKFMNKTKQGDELLLTVLVPYGDDAEYPTDAGRPIKKDSNTPDMYEFTGWYPPSTNITESRTCYAQFTFLDSEWYPIGILDIVDGHQLDYSNNTMSITRYNNDFNTAVKIPEEFTFADRTFKVVRLGEESFKWHRELELIHLPESISEISKQAFYDCENLTGLNLPNGLTIIGQEAFYSCNKLTDLVLPNSLIDIGSKAFYDCSSLKELKIPKDVTRIASAAFANCFNLTNLTVDPNNTKYYMNQDYNCLVDKDNKLLVHSLPTGNIPQDGSITQLGAYCFSHALLDKVTIPEGIVEIPYNAFNYCPNLTEIKFPSTLQKLDSTCFAWCHNLANIDLPEGLTTIQTYAFNGCALNEVVIPSSVSYIRDHAFGSMPSLNKVIFKKQVDTNGNIVLPKNIHYGAFAGSGTPENPIKFFVPWSEEQHEQQYHQTNTSSSTNIDPTFGASGWEFVFNYEEEE